MTQPISPQLSPPQYTYFNKLKYSIGNDPSVNVVNIIEIPQIAYLIPVLVDNLEKAQALATILNLHKVLGNIVIFVLVIYDGQIVYPLNGVFTAQDIVDLFEKALATNRYFEFAKAATPFPGEKVVYPVFSKSVIQFYNDDLSDFYKNFNQIAAFVFKDVLKNAIHRITIDPSTAQNNP